MSQTTRHIVIEPSSFHFQNDELFNEKNSFLNRDGTLLPFVRLRQSASACGLTVHTADALHNGRLNGLKVEYWSLGILDQFQKYIGNPSVSLEGFLLMEPPLVSPTMYKSLPLLTKHFKKVMVHNTVGDQYSLVGVDQSRLSKLYWPQPYEGPLNSYFEVQERLNKLVVISGAHNPRFRKPELYSQRIEAVAQLQRFDAIDLYGRGWDKTFSRHNAWLPFWRNRKKLASAYQGMCASKMDVLSKYRFSLCFENMPMRGYITEKIFDCFYAGTVPVYWGAPDIENHIPENCYIKFEQFRDFNHLWNFLSNMSIDEWQGYRNSIKEYLSSRSYAQHFHAMEEMIGIPLGCKK